MTHTPKSPRWGPFLKRPFLPLLAGIIAVAVAVAATITQVQPNAAAATISEREEVNNIVFQLSDDNIIGITDPEWDVRYEDNLDAAPKNFTKEKVDEMLAAEQKDLRETLGWDVANEDDFERFRLELNRLRQALYDSIRVSGISLEDEEIWTELLGVIEQLLAVECRGRCLPEEDPELVDNVVSAAAVGAALARLTAIKLVNVPEEYVDAVATAMGIVMAYMMFLIFKWAPILYNIRSSRLRSASVAVMAAALIAVHQNAQEAREMAATLSTPSSPAQLMRDEAQKLADRTPTPDDNPKDFDIIHDEH